MRGEVPRSLVLHVVHEGRSDCSARTHLGPEDQDVAAVGARQRTRGTALHQQRRGSGAQIPEAHAGGAGRKQPAIGHEFEARTWLSIARIEHVDFTGVEVPDPDHRLTRSCQLALDASTAGEQVAARVQGQSRDHAVEAVETLGRAAIERG